MALITSLGRRYKRALRLAPHFVMRWERQGQVRPHRPGGTALCCHLQF